MSRCLWLAASALLLGAASAAAADPDLGGCLPSDCGLSEGAPSEFLLSIHVNGHALPGHYMAHAHKHRLYVESEAFAAARLLRADAFPLNDSDEVIYVPLTGDGLDWYLDLARQTLHVQAQSHRFARSSVALAAVNRAGDERSSEVGGFFNYDVAVERYRQRDSAGGLFELGMFSPYGVLTHTALARSHGARATRLETTWTHDVPSRMLSARVGDAVSRAGAWGRAVRFGGVQFATNFATQPEFSVFPLPTISGTAALPSTAELLVNQTSRGTHQVPPGPFELTDIPTAAGQGTVTLVVRDLLGREQRVSQAFYASSDLLRPGLSDFSFEAGAQRDDFGLAGSQYGRGFAAGTYRHGISNVLTAEARAEVLEGQHSAGLAANWLIAQAGVVSAAAAFSRSDQGSGWLATLGFDRQARDFAVGGRMRWQSPDFAQVGQVPGERGPKRLMQAYAGVFGVAVQWLEQHSHDGVRTRLIGASKGLQLPGLGHLHVNLFQADLQLRQRTASVVLTIPLGVAQSASASVTTGSVHRRDVELQQSRPVGSGYGYRVMAGTGDTERGLVAVGWQHEQGVAQFEAARAGSASGLRAGVSGAVLWLGDQLRASRWLGQSFALVQVPGAAGVRVYADNQPVARTDEDGYALLPELRPYQRNAVRIDGGDLGWDVTLQSLAQDVTPAWRSGRRVTFLAARSRNALVSLLRDDGRPVPPGSTVQLSGHSFSVGFAGETYLEHLQPHNALLVSWPGGACIAQLTLPDRSEPLPDLGALRCAELTR